MDADCNFIPFLVVNKAGIDGGTLFYIIIAVIVLISGFIQKKNAKNNQEPSKPEHAPDPWKEIFDFPEMDEKPEPEYKPEPVKVEVQKKPEVKKAPEPINPFLSQETLEYLKTREGTVTTFDDVIKQSEIGSAFESEHYKPIEIDL
ncbi:MAG TPA: hypothetical protein VIO15_12250, partial [Bacteroidales bacterium]